MIIHIYSLIYILLLHIPVLIERIVDLCFSLEYVLETQKTRPSWRNQFAAHLLILRADSPAGVLTVIRRVVSPFFTTKQTSVEISIVNFSLTFLSSQGCLNRSFLSTHWMFCGRPEFETIFHRREWRAFFSKNKDINSSFNGDIKNKLKCVLRLKEGRRKGLKHRKRRSKKFFLWSLWENK